jgi:hypothetical protein
MLCYAYCMSIFITAKTKTIRTIKPGDPKFKLNTGLITSDRASIEIDLKCPDYYAKVVLEAYNKGWIKPIAHVTEREYILIGLNSD